MTRVHMQLRPQKIPLPVLDAALDGLAIAELFLEHLPGQRRQLLIARKAQLHQLFHGEFRDAWLHVRRQ